MGYRDKGAGIWFLAIAGLIIYLLFNTGIVSDDISFTADYKDASFAKALIPKSGTLGLPLENYFFFMWYNFTTFNNLAVINVLKIAYMLLSFYLIAKFFSIYLGRKDALLASFFFLFFPSHDSTVYWFLGQYLTLSMAFYLYAYYLAYRDWPEFAFIAALAASFISYGSPIIALSLFALFLLNKEVKKGLVILVPNLIFITYYVLIVKFGPGVIDRIPASVDLSAFGRQFLLQVAGFVDAVSGPSMWLKVYYSLSQLLPVSVIIGICAVIFLFKTHEDGGRGYDWKLAACLSILTLFSFTIFASTGFYPQIAFNMGNRVTIFGSLLVTYLFVLIPVPRPVKLLLFSVMLFSILGISDHWKVWNVRQQVAIRNISNNQELKRQKGGLVYVSGNQFSKFGGIAHIEFLSEEAVTGPLFSFIFKGGIAAKPINRRHRYENGYLVDAKYGEKTPVGDGITVYDSENDRLLSIRAEDINSYIDSLPADKRHWIQLAGNRRLKDMIVNVSPRLKYAL